jgi:NAD kinase
MSEKIVLVTRKTRLEGLIERFNTREQARFYIEHAGGNFKLYELEHETYYAALKSLRRSLEPLAKLHVIERSYLPNFLFGESDVVVTIGIDGLVVNTAKYLNGQPLIAVNPDPVHIDGILLPFSVSQAAGAVELALAGKGHFTPVSMAQVRLNDGQSLLAFNDLFIGVRTHVSARYRIQAGKLEEHHSSSGIIVSTGAGSTGWLSSLFNMANGMVAAFGQAEIPLSQPTLQWNSERLVYVVREPFVSKTSSASIVCGMITPEAPLLIESEMPENGVIFSDGVERDFLAFNAGAIATVGLSPVKTRLVKAE